jgi:hypothetical protein
MTSAVAIMERLLDGDIQQKEHSLETFSPHLGDLQTRMNSTFDKLVGECEAVFGAADLNSAPVDGFLAGVREPLKMADRFTLFDSLIGNDRIVSITSVCALKYTRRKKSLSTMTLP